MSENTEKKITMHVEIIEKFNEATANLENWKQALEDATTSGEKTKKEIKNITKEVKNAQKEFDTAAKMLKALQNAQSGEFLKSLEEIGNEIKKEAQEKISKIQDSFRNLKLDKIPALPIKLFGQSDEDYKNSDAYKAYEDFFMKLSEEQVSAENELRKLVEEIKTNGLSSFIEKVKEKFGKEKKEELSLFFKTESEKLNESIQKEEETVNEKKAKYEEEYTAKTEELKKQYLEGRITLEEYTEALLKLKKQKEDEFYEYEAVLRMLRMQQLNLDTAAELVLAEGKAAEMYKIQLNSYQEERKLHAGNAEEIKRIDKEIAELRKKRAEGIKGEVEKWKDIVFNGYEEIKKEVDKLTDKIIENKKKETEKEKEAIEEKKKNEIEALREQYDEMKSISDDKIALEEEFNEKKLLIEKKYNDQSAKLDEELEKKKNNIERQKLIRDKAFALSQAIINTSLAVTNALLSKPFMPMGPVMAGIAAAKGAVEIATIANQKIPEKARRGMLVKGKMHEQGGEIIEAEDGEIIINRRSSQLYAPLLSAINEAGGGVPFVRAGSDGGYAARTLKTEPKSITAAEMREVLKDLKIYTSIQEIREGDKNFTDTLELRSW